MDKHRNTRPLTLLIVFAMALMATLSATTSTADAQLSALPDGTTCFSFDESDAGSNAQTHDSYLHTITNASATAAVVASITGSVESIAVRNDTGQIFAFDSGDTDQLYEVDPATGAFIAPTEYLLTGSSGVNAMFFVNDQDGDPTNDALWVLLNSNNILVGFLPNGGFAGPPVTLQVPADSIIEGATWLAEPGPGEFFISYAPDAFSGTSLLASLGTGTTPSATPTTIGTTEIDVEGLGTDGADALYLTTGNYGTDSLYSVTTGAATNLITDLASIAGNQDFESVDCGHAAVELTKLVDSQPVDNGDGTLNYEFTFVITNSGHLPLTDIVLTDLYAFSPSGVTATDLVSSNNCPAVLLINESCTYVETVNLSGRPGVYINEATVDAIGAFGQPVSATDDVDFFIPEVEVPDADDPVDCPNPGMPILPDATVPATFSQSGSYNGSYSVANAFDGVGSTMWLSQVWQSPAWFGVDFGADTYLVDAYDISFSNGGLTTRAPRDWTLEGSNDGLNWTVLDARTNETNWLGTETRGFAVSQPQAFSHFRLHITQDNDSRSDIVVASVGELRLYCPRPDAA